MKFLFVKIKEDHDREKYEYQYDNKIDLQNFKKFALFLQDLKIYYGVNIEKAFEEYKKLQEERFPW